MLMCISCLIIVRSKKLCFISLRQPTTFMVSASPKIDRGDVRVAPLCVLCAPQPSVSSLIFSCEMEKNFNLTLLFTPK